MARSGGIPLSRQAPRLGADRRSSNAELADAIRKLQRLAGPGRLFRYRCDDEFLNLTACRLNEYIREYLGEEFSAKDFRTWGGPLIAAIDLVEHGVRASARA